MSEANKSVIRRYFEEVWNNKNLALIDELAASTYVDHDPYNPDVRGPEGMRQLVTKYQTAFPDLHFTIEDLLADGDKVVAVACSKCRNVAHSEEHAKRCCAPRLCGCGTELPDVWAYTVCRECQDNNDDEKE